MKENLKSRRFLRVICFLLAAVLLSGIVLPTGAAAEKPSLEYRFSGKDAQRSGYAEGTLTIEPLPGEPSDGYYILYFANDTEILPEYAAIAAVRMTGKTVRFQMPQNMAIPQGATQIAVFASDERVAKSTDLKDARLTVIPEEKRFDSGKEELRFASLSDLHFNYNYAKDKWIRILQYFKEIDLNLIAISGDYSESGGENQLIQFNEGIEAANYTGTIWASIGNHDTGNRENWKRIFAEYGCGGTDEYYYKTAPNGDVFIFMAQDMLTSTGQSNTQDCFSEQQLDWLEGVLSQYAGTGVNIFIYEHANFLNWGAGDVIPGIYVQPLVVSTSHPNVTRFKAILDEYKEVIICTGHTHVAFSELCNFSDMNGKTARTVHNSSISQPRTVNSSKTGYDYVTNATNSEGYICTVYENDIVYRGMDFHTMKYLPSACIIMECISEKHDRVNELVSLKVSSGSSSFAFLPMYSSPEKAAIKVEAVYSDGTTKEVKDYTTTVYGRITAVWGQTASIMPDQNMITNTASHLLISWGGKAVYYPLRVTNPCTDVKKSDWFYEGVTYAYQNGLVSGISDTKFGPNVTMNRAMVVTILHRLAGKPVAETHTEKMPFTDVGKKMWYTDAVLWASENEIVNGYGGGLFKPEQEITREQFAAILYRYASFCKNEVNDRTELSVFPDAKSVSSWAKDSLSWAVAGDLITGVGTGNGTLLMPRGSATRAQAATILMRFIENLKNE